MFAAHQAASSGPMSRVDEKSKVSSSFGTLLLSSHSS